MKESTTYIDKLGRAIRITRNGWTGSWAARLVSSGELLFIGGHTTLQKKADSEGWKPRTRYVL